MRVVLLDRDGVINEDSSDYIRSPGDFRPIPGSLEAIGRLTQAGFRVAVATNQSGLARGLFDIHALNQIHALLFASAAAVGGHIELIAFCPHGPEAGCSCRKPAAGLLTTLASRLAVPILGVPFIGDSLRDLEAAHRAGARPMLVLSGNGEQTAAQLPGHLSDVPIFDNLLAAAESLLAEQRNESSSSSI